MPGQPSPSSALGAAGAPPHQSDQKSAHAAAGAQRASSPTRRPNITGHKADDHKFTKDEVDYWRGNPKTKMVRWYGTQTLFQSASDVILTSLLGARVDGRLHQTHLGPAGPVASPAKAYFDYGGKPEPFWFDYVADTGEGWNPTYAIAVGVSHSFHGDTGEVELLDSGEVERLERGPGEGKKILRAGALLVMGGDEIYPSASHTEYERKLLRPYIAAATEERVPEAGASRDVFAIPGNHDWYDGLVAFCGVFLQERRFGRWETRQHRSYFALRLPRDWWLIAVDIPPDRPIDEPQKAWLKQLAIEITEASDGRTPNIILCLADPVWRAHPDVRRTTQHNLLYVENTLLASHKAHIRMRISGDYHHYERHLSKEPERIHNIICGGGGAFLHPTHGIPKDCTLGVEKLQRTLAFPSSARSCWLSLRLLLVLPVLWNNLMLFLVMGGLYGAMAFTYVDGGWSMYILWALIATAGFWVLVSADPTPRRWRVWGRLFLLATPNLLAAFLLARLALAWFVGQSFMVTECVPDYSVKYSFWDLLRWPGQVACMRFWAQLAYAGLVGLAGIFASALFTSIYMYISLLSGVHWNEAFSLLQREGYKSFLRMKITTKGMTVYVLGLRHVPRRWRFREGKGRLFDPVDADDLKFEVVEKFELGATAAPAREGAGSA